MTQRNTLKLSLLAVTTVIGVIFVALRYAGLGPLVGIRPPEVRLELADTGGLTVQNEVTYRGVPVGDIGTVRPTGSGVEATIRLHRGAPPVPASSVAVVTDRSAIGEVYVDLQPDRPEGPFLGDGSVIPRERTRTPVPVDTALRALNGIATAVPVPEYRRTVDELAAAFDHTGPDLGRLLDSSATFVAEARRALPATTGLVHDSTVVLGTQARLGPQVTAFSRGLAAFTDQLRRDDPELRRLVDDAPTSATQVRGLVAESGPDLSRTITNLLTVMRILEPRRDGLEQFLVTGAWGAAIGHSVLPGDGRLHFGIVLNLDDPPPCRRGYLRPEAGWRPASATEVAAMDTAVHCDQAPPVDPRGAQHAPTTTGSTPASKTGAVPATTAFAPLSTAPGDTGPPVILPGLGS